MRLYLQSRVALKGTNIGATETEVCRKRSQFQTAVADSLLLEQCTQRVIVNCRCARTDDNLSDTRLVVNAVWGLSGEDSNEEF